MLELTVALILIGLNGLFSLSELAIVSSRNVRLRAMAEAGKPAHALRSSLARTPAVSLDRSDRHHTGWHPAAPLRCGARRPPYRGIGGGRHRALARRAAGLRARHWCHHLSVVVIGELVPKHLALKNAEGIACAVAPLMAFLSRIAGPLVWLLDASTKLVFRLFGNSMEPASAVTEEEIKSIMAEAETAGVIETGERRMISGVLRLGDRAVKGVMTARTDVDWIDLDQDALEIRERLIKTAHTRLPVAEGDPDNMIGVVQSRELLAAMLSGEALDVRAHIRRAPVIPDTVDALDVLEVLRSAEVPLALVHDEYGHFEGIVTPADILDAIAGAFRSDEEASTEASRARTGRGCSLADARRRDGRRARHFAAADPRLRNCSRSCHWCLAPSTANWRGRGGIRLALRSRRYGRAPRR